LFWQVLNGYPRNHDVGNNATQAPPSLKNKAKKGKAKMSVQRDMSVRSFDNT
jgi:hypothetical protein